MTLLGNCSIVLCMHQCRCLTILFACILYMVWGLPSLEMLPRMIASTLVGNETFPAIIGHPRRPQTPVSSRRKHEQEAEGQASAAASLHPSSFFSIAVPADETEAWLDCSPSQAPAIPLRPFGRCCFWRMGAPPCLPLRAIPLPHLPHWPDLPVAPHRPLPLHRRCGALPPLPPTPRRRSLWPRRLHAPQFGRRQKRRRARRPRRLPQPRRVPRRPLEPLLRRRSTLRRASRPVRRRRPCPPAGTRGVCFPVPLLL